MGELKADWVARHKLTVDDYYRLGEAGILREDSRVELIAGELIDRAPIRSRHAGFINKIAGRLRAGSGQTAIVAIQNPLRLSTESEVLLRVFRGNPGLCFTPVLETVAPDIFQICFGKGRFEYFKHPNRLRAWQRG